MIYLDKRVPLKSDKQLLQMTMPLIHSGLNQHRADYWRQCLCDATGFDEPKSVIEIWRADESAFDPDPDGTIIAVQLIMVVKDGDMLLIQYLLEQSVPPDEMAAVRAAKSSPEEWNSFIVMDWI